MDSRLPHERRTVSRIRGDSYGLLSLHVEPHGPSIAAGVADISIQGFGLVVDRTFQPGTSLTVQPGPGGRALPTPLLAKVRHAHMLPDGAWLLGCSLSRNLTADDMMVLG
jgi:hypothetical protein